MTVAQTRAARRKLIRAYTPKGKAAEQQKEAQRISKAGKMGKGGRK
jgi:hypothetical protein